MNAYQTQPDYAEYIKDAIDIKTALQYYGVEFNRFGFACCPFHNETIGSLRTKANYYNCFGCGAGGDVINFVMRFFNLDFPESLRKLNTDFNLCLPLIGATSIRQACEAQNRIRQIKKERAETERAEAERNNAYWALWDEYFRLDTQLRDYKPISRAEPLHPLFVEALHKIDYQKYLIDYEMDKRELL